MKQLKVLTEKARARFKLTNAQVKSYLNDLLNVQKMILDIQDKQEAKSLEKTTEFVWTQDFEDLYLICKACSYHNGEIINLEIKEVTLDQYLDFNNLIK